MEDKKKKIIELMLLLDLRVNEYKIINKKYEENKETMDEKELKNIESKFEKILEDIDKINNKLRKLKEE